MMTSNLWFEVQFEIGMLIQLHVLLWFLEQYFFLFINCISRWWLLWLEVLFEIGMLILVRVFFWFPEPYFFLLINCISRWWLVVIFFGLKLVCWVCYMYFYDFMKNISFFCHKLYFSRWWLVVTFGLRCGLKLVCWAEGRILEEGNIGGKTKAGKEGRRGTQVASSWNVLSCQVWFSCPPSHRVTSQIAWSRSTI